MGPPPPAYLDEGLQKRWQELAPAAVRNGTLTASSRDSFARFIIADQEYLRATQQVLRALRTGNAADASTWSGVQDRLFKELAASAKLFGLAPETF